MEDAWKSHGVEPPAENLNGKAKEPVERPGSPEQPPPGPAIHVDIQAKGSRQASKVQNLVEMFDGMERRSRSVSPMEPSLRKTSSNASPIPSPEPRSEGLVIPESLDLGPLVESPQEPEPELEAEKAIKAEEQTPEAKPAPREKPPPIKLPPEDRLTAIGPTHERQEELNVITREDSELSEASVDEEHQIEEVRWNTLQSSVETTQTAVLREAPKEPKLKVKPPSDPFSIDVFKVDELFSSEKSSFPPPEPVPDVIIDDTFASSGERKAWYLISRPGSMRKHDLGDDENYVRVNWNSSQVRGQAIRIVRRWMEEDSITGRVVLGRRTGPAGAKIFNWDSSAPPVEISELLGRKSHSRQTSVASKATALSPVAPAFGWSSSPVSSPTVADPPPISDKPPVAESTVPAKLSAPALPKLKPISPVVQPVQPLTSPTSPLAQPPHTAQAQSDDEEEDDKDDEDDDDDWGEMVSSPTDQTNGTFPSISEAIESNATTKAADASSFTEVVTPSDSGAGTASKTSSSMADWAEAPRSSFDAPPTQGFIPNSLSKGSTASWTDMTRHSTDTSATQGFLPHSHSKSSTVSWATRTSLDAILSEDLIPSKAMHSVKDKSRPQSWAFGNVNFLDGSPKPPLPPTKDLPIHTRKALSLLSQPPRVLEGNPSTIQTSPTTPRKPPTPPPKDNSLKDDALKDASPNDDSRIDNSPQSDSPKYDEIVATILRGLPDLSYMLR